MVVAFNTQDIPHNRYTFEVPDNMILTEILNSDENQYGGNTIPGEQKKVIKSVDHKLTLDLPGFSAIVYDAVILKEEKKKKKAASGKAEKTEKKDGKKRKKEHGKTHSGKTDKKKNS